MARTIWFGETISRQLKEASKEAIDEILNESAQDAEQHHWYQSRAGAHLERNTLAEPAKIGRDGVVGRFGTTRREGFYGYFLELRQGFLRPAADRHFPDLPARITEKLR